MISEEQAGDILEKFKDGRSRHDEFKNLYDFLRRGEYSETTQNKIDDLFDPDVKTIVISQEYHGKACLSFRDGLYMCSYFLKFVSPGLREKMIKRIKSDYIKWLKTLSDDTITYSYPISAVEVTENLLQHKMFDSRMVDAVKKYVKKMYEIYNRPGLLSQDEIRNRQKNIESALNLLLVVAQRVDGLNR